MPVTAGGSAPTYAETGLRNAFLMQQSLMIENILAIGECQLRSEEGNDAVNPWSLF
jgi:hypothetical protein